MSKTSLGLLRRALGFIGTTLKDLFKSVLRLMISAAVLVVLLAVLLTILVWPQPLPDSAALRVAPQGKLVEQLSQTPPLNQLLGAPPAETLVRDITRAIEAAANDPRINSLVLELGGLSGAGISKLEDVSVALSRFKDSGKPIVAVGDSYSQTQYFLASHADHIYLNPFGAVEVTGFSSFRPYFKDALDNLKVNVHVFKVGSYKDAVEPFMRRDMSDASRRHNREWLNELWQHFTRRIEQLRGLPVDAINQYIASLDAELKKFNGDTAQLAVSAGLVDKLTTRAEMRAALIELAGGNGNGGYLNVGLKRYLQEIETQQAPDHSAGKIAVVVASGEILDGSQPAGAIGGDSLAKLLRQVRKDDQVDALVLRIDSPGGSAYASEVIRQEILQLKTRGIPVVVSMGSLAASGGYWISANADQIWAAPTTLTGSIGVFGMIPTLEQSLAEIGIHMDGVATTELSDFGSPLLPMSDQSARVIQSAVDGIYRKFLELVAAGRHSTPQAVDKVAQGRVWTGARAKQLGLVDQLGNLEAAIDAAAGIAGVRDYRVAFVEPPLSLRELLLRALADRIGQLGVEPLAIDTILPAFMTEHWQQTAAPLIDELNTLNDPRGYYLRCYDCNVP